MFELGLAQNYKLPHGWVFTFARFAVLTTDN